jgi:pantetheine-phosphate adenylyltransferase
MERARHEPSQSARPRIAVYAGVFDPPTLAHLEIIETALRLFDRLVVVVAVNPSKAQTMFTTEERVMLLRASLPEAMRPNVEVEAYDGLIAPYAESRGACALVRGMRPVSDPDYEIAYSLMNAKLAPSLPTVLLVARADHVYLSSTFVRDSALMDGLIVPGTVPPPVEEALRARVGRRAAFRAGLAEGSDGADPRMPPQASAG